MKQIAMVMDLNKCLGCQTCTAACKTQWTNRFGREYMYWNNVETQPGQGYPKGYMDYNAGWDEKGNLKKGGLPRIPEDYGIPWEYNYKEVLNGDAKTLKPDSEPTGGPNWDEDEGEGEYPNSYFFYLPRICNHCTNPACLAACPNKAIHKREEDGIVLVDLKRCKGIRDCISACPYKKVYFNHSRAKAEKGIAGQSEKCVYKLVKKWKVAIPLRPDFGTLPNVYYVPPLSPPKFNEKGEVTDEPRIPMEFLKKLFGSEVEEALKTLKNEMDKKAKGEKSELMDTLIAYKHSEMFRI
ncbi:MAG: 4Fe-4S dicluster domain-containing protein [Nitrospinae bacterium]|nr:4Fe-4S dicluster domain-containing protein [Nitrospinota bacterium]